MTGTGPDGRARQEELRAAARELVEVAVTIREAAAHATAALTDPAVLAGLPRAPVAGLRAQGALARAVTHGSGLGYAPAGGRLATVAARLGALAGAESLAVRVLATSLRLRIAAVALDHPELTTDPALVRLIEAAAADRDLEAVRALRALLRDRGAVGALSALAPVFGEVLALRALLDENPLNDAAAWLIATGGGYATADPITGISNRIIAVLDRGEGGARRVEPGPAESGRLSSHGSLLGFLGDISVIGTTGRVLLRSVEGPDGVIRHVVQAPGMRAGRLDADSPQDLLGAFSSAVLDSSPYSRALARAVADYGIPPGAEIALIGHSAGGAAVLNLAQDREFCARYRVTHAVAVGSPVDFKRPADPRTWVAAVTNQHDIIPTLDGQGAGACAGLHPGWYVVDYADPTHLFPLCHSIDRYIGNLAHDLPEAREHIDERLTPYRGRIVRTQAYRLFDVEAPESAAEPVYSVELPGGAVEVPVRCRDGAAVTACFAADPEAAARAVRGTGLGPPVRVPGGALVTVHAAWHRRGGLGEFRELHLTIGVPGPRRPPGPPGRADRRRRGGYVAGWAIDAEAAHAAAGALWGGGPHLAPVEFRLGGGAAHLAAGGPDERILTLSGPLGPGLPARDPGLVRYARHGDDVLRSSVRARARGLVYLAPRLRLAPGDSAHPLAQLVRELGLDGARPLVCRATVARQTVLGAGVPVPRA